MKKSVSIVYGVLLVIGFILMALSFAFAGKKNTSFAEDSRRIELQPDRVVEVGEDVREYYFDSNQMQSEFSELTFFSVHQCVEVYADGEQIYSLEKSSTVFGRTPGTGWNTIQLQEGVKSFSVRIEAVYPAVRDHVTRFYQENDGQMVYQTMRGSVPEIMVSTVDGAIGIMLLIYYAIARRKVKMGPGILYFGIFTLMMGMWSMNEAELVAYMVKSRTAASYTGYMMIMLMIAPFAAFLQEFSEVEEKYISNIICICSFANVVVCTVLHMTGICEFKNTVFCTHFLMACDLLYLLYVILQRYRARGMDRRVRVCIWGLVILLVSYAVDMSAYYIGWRRTDVIGRFGFLLFICLLAREATAVSMEKIDEGRKAEIYRELAEHDMPTGLRNRNAYDEWVSENARDRETAIVTFDLNDLKRCNDTFGRAAGDKYIQDAAKLISEVFEPAGVCYRIGGDEFCAVIRHARSEWVEERLRRLEYLEWKYNEGKMDVPMRIAYGYAIFDEQYDKNMEETRNRADVKMYEKKRAIKAEERK